MKQAKTIEIGQRFRSIGAVTRAPAYTYEVRALFRSTIDNLHYARLILIDDPSQTKSIAVSALLNPRHFSCVV